jgi:hypothetical protein
MADKSSRESPKDANKDIKEHELVGKIIRDINRPGNVTVLCGYIGKSGSEDVVRLYTDLEFGEYLEIKKDDILASKEVSDEVIPFGGTCIFVDDNAEIRRVRIETTKQQAMFLGGKVSETFVRPRGMRAAMGRRGMIGRRGRVGRLHMRRFAQRRVDTQPQSICFACETVEQTFCEVCPTEPTPCGTCGGTCEATCEGSCGGTCEGSCGGTCEATCEGSCGGTCGRTCEATCEATCEDTCAESICFMCESK